MRNYAILGAATLAGVAAGGYLADARKVVVPGIVAAAAQMTPTPGEPSRQPLYYREPSGQPYWSAGPKQTTGGRDYVPVYEDAAPTLPAAAAVVGAPGGRGRILYYRNPMGLPDTSPVPKKDSMGMDYIPVYEDEANQPAGTVTISPERVQMLGVRTEAASERSMTRSIRAVGTVAPDERRIAVVAPRFEGWIERLLVNATGQSVRRGETLFEVYSPEVALAEQEYAIARQTVPAVADATLARLANFGLSPSEIARLKHGGKASRTVALAAPLDGVVLEKTALQGLHFAAGDALYRIADLSSVWLLADVFEQDLAQVGPGENASTVLAAYPDRRFAGKVTFVYPTVNAATRTAKVRIEIPNPDGLLKPDMYATVEIAAPLGAAPAVTVPDSAVLDSGTRQVVLIERGLGRFEPRPVATGRRAEGYVEIRNGIAAGEKVVVGANFLIDAESNLRAALQGFAAPTVPTKEGALP